MAETQKMLNQIFIARINKDNDIGHDDAVIITIILCAIANLYYIYTRREK